MVDNENDPIVDLMEEIDKIIGDIDNDDVIDIYNSFKNNMDNAVMLLNNIGDTRDEIEGTLKVECEDSSLKNLLLARESKRLLSVDINYRFLLDNQLKTCLTSFKDILELLKDRKDIMINKKTITKSVKREDAAVKEDDEATSISNDMKELIKRYNECVKSELIDEQKEIELAVIYEEAERLGKEKFDIFKGEIGE